MNQNAEIVLDGSYLYYQGEEVYSEENFKLVYLPDIHSYHIYAEILSRVETGEFLKILVRYEMNKHLIPYLVRIEKSLGNKYAQEEYKLDLSNFELYYSFKNSKSSQTYKKTITGKHYLTSPCLCTAAIFTMSRKFDASGRTPVILISSDNEWSYKGPPTDKIIYSEFKSRELANFEIQGSTLSASHLCLYEHDSTSYVNEVPVELYLSKYFSIPYQLTQDQHKIVVKHLKKH
jgi:hypothetical protein